MAICFALPLRVIFQNIEVDDRFITIIDLICGSRRKKERERGAGSDFLGVSPSRERTLLAAKENQSANRTIRLLLSATTCYHGFRSDH